MGKKVVFFEYFYYLKPNFLPLYLPELSGYFRQSDKADAAPVNHKTCEAYFISSYQKNTQGTMPPENPAIAAFSDPAPVVTSCFTNSWCNMQFVLTCFGFKWLLYVLYIRTVMQPYLLYEWLILPLACIRYKWMQAKTKQKETDASPLAQKQIPSGYQISVVIPTKNRYTLLHQLIQQLHQQTYPPSEIIIVDQSELPEPLKMSSTIPLIYLHFTGGGHSSARNQGIAVAKNEYILSLDDDSAIGPHLISAHLHTFEQFPDADVSVGPYYTPLEKEIHPKWAWSFSPHLPACNAMVRKSFFIKTGGYNSGTDQLYLSDPDLYLRAIKLKGKLLLNHAACICHLEPETGGLKQNSRHRFKFLGLCYYPAEQERLFYLNLMGFERLNKWYFYQSQKFLSKKMVRLRLGFLRGIAIVLLAPVWQLHYLLVIAKLPKK